MHPSNKPAEEQNATTCSPFVALGTGLLILVLVAVITGIALIPFYHATAAGSYQSVAAMQASAPLRWLRAVHHWASALLIFVGAAYLVYGLFAGCYRHPIRLAWVAAVGLVVLFLLFQITGHLLPWDSQAVSTAAIESGVAANVPVVGPIQARLVRGGGDAISPGTLKAWYVVHVALLPVALAVMVGLLILQVRRAGLRLAIPRVPLAAILVFLALAAIAIPAPLGTAATPADYTSYTAQSEWYVLPLHALLVMAQKIRPDLAFVGTIVIPSLVVLGLIALPWLDRRLIGDSPSLLVRGLTGFGVAATLLLVVTNLAHMEPIFHREQAPSTSLMTTHSSAPRKPLDPALVQQGKAVFDKNGCTACHALGGKGAAVGPPLDGEGTRKPDLNWQIQHLKDPASVTKGSTMPPYKQLGDKDLRALATFLLSLK